MEDSFVIASGLVKFYTRDDLKRYLKSMVEAQDEAVRAYGDRLGELLREMEGDKGGSKQGSVAPEKVTAKGWAKMGTVLVNAGDTRGAMIEILFQMHQEAKLRHAKVTAAFKSFEDRANVTIPEAGLYYLQIKNGIPEKIVADLGTKPKEQFHFASEFQIV